MSKLGIIIPVYNVEKYLKKCINSVIQQTYTDFRIVIVDDGSVDNSGSLCDKMAIEDQRINVVHKQNGGLMSAWKYGMSYLEDADYIGFVDSDDWIDLDMYATMMKKVEETNADIVTVGWVQELENGMQGKREPISLSGYYDRKTIENDILPKMISGGNYVNRGLSPNRVTKVIKRKLIANCFELLNEDVSIGEDLLTIFCVMQQASSIYVFDSYYPYHYRKNTESIINRYSDNKYDRIKQLRISLLEANNRYSYDMRKQINTDYIKLVFMQLDNEILYSGRTIAELCTHMKLLFEEKEFRKIINESESERLPIKYRLYLFLIMHKMYYFAIALRKIKHV